MYIGLTIVGNLTADPKMQYTKTGKPVCNFIVAANPGPDVTRYFEVTVWNKLAETCQQFLHQRAHRPRPLLRCGSQCLYEPWW